MGVYTTSRVKLITNARHPVSARETEKQTDTDTDQSDDMLNLPQFCLTITITMYVCLPQVHSQDQTATRASSKESEINSLLGGGGLIAQNSYNQCVLLVSALAQGFE